MQSFFTEQTKIADAVMQPIGSYEALIIDI